MNVSFLSCCVFLFSFLSLFHFCLTHSSHRNLKQPTNSGYSDDMSGNITWAELAYFASQDDERFCGGYAKSLVDINSDRVVKGYIRDEEIRKNNEQMNETYLVSVGFEW